MRGWLPVLMLLVAGCTTPSTPTPDPGMQAGVAADSLARQQVPVASLPIEPILALDAADAHHLAIASSQFDNRTYTIHVAVSHDGGANWTDHAVQPQTTVGSYARAFATAAVWQGPTLLVMAWLEADQTVPANALPPAIVLLSSKDDGASFASSLVRQGVATSTIWDDIRPPLAVTADGHLLTAYTASRDDGVGFAAAVEVIQPFVATSVDGGQSWIQVPLDQPATGLTTITDEQIPAVGDFQLAVAGSHVVASWTTRTHFYDDPVLWAATSDNGGLTFGLPTQVAAVTHGDCPLSQIGGLPDVCTFTAFQHPMLALAGSSAALAFTTYADGAAQAVVAQSSDGGATWGEAKPVVPNDHHDRFTPRIAYAGSTLHAVYYDASYGSDDKHIDVTHAALAANGTTLQRISAASYSRQVDDLEDGASSLGSSSTLAAVGQSLAVTWREPHHSRMQLLFADLS